MEGRGRWSAAWAAAASLDLSLSLEPSAAFLIAMDRVVWTAQSTQTVLTPTLDVCGCPCFDPSLCAPLSYSPHAPLLSHSPFDLPFAPPSSPLFAPHCFPHPPPLFALVSLHLQSRPVPSLSPAPPEAPLCEVNACGCGQGCDSGDGVEGAERRKRRRTKRRRKRSYCCHYRCCCRRWRKRTRRRRKDRLLCFLRFRLSTVAAVIFCCRSLSLLSSSNRSGGFSSDSGRSREATPARNNAVGDGRAINTASPVHSNVK